MGLRCDCDFDISYADSWYEKGRRNVPPANTRCYECSALLPEDEKASCILLWEVYEPGTERPPSKDDEVECGLPPFPTLPYQLNITAEERAQYQEDCAEWEEAYGPILDACQQRQDDWDEENGWNSEYDRCEKSHIHYRCERCAGLAESYEDLGFCMIAPGELIDANVEYADEYNGVKLKWVPDENGTLNPARWTRQDHIKNALRIRWRRTIFWFRFGWMLDFRWKIVWPIERQIKRWRGEQWPVPAKIKMLGG